MLDKIEFLWARLQVRWHVVAAAFLAAAPVLLDQLGVIDLKPILSKFMDPGMAAIVVGLMPVILAFLKPMVHTDPAPVSE
jgi:hypothetical protein